ncbi:MAG TPA: PAS domain-containing protein [Ktedonobacteraceae bacterium]|nr:PAS domain-containing protein [Ktedonobacteraceae bacterium]
MMPGQVEQIEYILGNVSIGVAILDAQSLHIRYANSYLCSLLGETLTSQEVSGRSVEELLPASVSKTALPLLHYVALTGKGINYSEVPYEGFLEARGKTYWHVSIEATRIDGDSLASPLAARGGERGDLLVFVEDVTDAVRSRLHLNAIHSISAAIATGAALPQVLDRILQAMQDMVGSKRCAVFLIEQSLADSEARLPGYEEPSRVAEERTRGARLAAQKGVHVYSYDWHPVVDEHILLGCVEQAGHALIITDTSQEPEIELPFLIHQGKPQRPGSALCVPIFEPPSHIRAFRGQRKSAEKDESVENTLLGSIEVYHRRARSFPAEEVALLEQFAQQAGLAIQTARLFRSIDRYARVASRNAHQKENVMQAIPDGVVIFDPRWRVADVNHAARKLFGWPDDIIGVPVAQAFISSPASIEMDLSDIADLPELLERRALAEQIEELKFVSAEGQAYTLRVSYAPIRDELGDLFAFIVIYHDVTREAEARERIEAEVVARTAELAQRNRALQEAKEEQELAHARMALLLDRMPSGVLLVEYDNTVTLINGQATHILQSMGITLAPARDTTPQTAVVNGLNSEWLLRQATLYAPNGTPVPYEEQPLYRALAHGEASEAELHTTRLNGDPLYLLVNAAPLRGADGSVMSAILVLHEISKMKALEREREDFFTTMAHELKTPLANIRAHLSALLVRDLQWSSEEQYAFLQTADEQVERLVRMINQFLDASRVEAGALRLELEPILVAELLEDLQDRLEALIASSGRHLQVNLPPDLPAVRGDYELIISVLTNLLSNAFRYAPAGDQVQLDVELQYDAQSKRANNIVFTVTDRGPGMTREQQTKIFTRFSTFAAMSRPAMDRPGQPMLERQRGGGRWSAATGLGLYISRGIVEAHGSALVLKSSPGQGASFSFTLPIFSRKRGQSSRKSAQER